MASADETLTTKSSSAILREDDPYDHSFDDGYADIVHQSYHNHHFLKPQSRLSMCTSNSAGGHAAECNTNHDASMIVGEDADSYGDGIRTFISGLSIESFDADDEEFSDEMDDHVSGPGELYWDSDDDKKTEESSYHSLPATPAPRWIRKRNTGSGVLKEYASENEAQKLLMMRKKSTSVRRRRSFRRWEFETQLDDDDNDDDDGYFYEKNKRDVHIQSDHGASWKNYGYNNSFSGESENGGGNGGGLMVITRPKGGQRSLCLDLEEVKACEDLGFELEHRHMFEIMPSRLSLSTSTMGTATICSSGGNSPIANWRISSPGYD